MRERRFSISRQFITIVVKDVFRFALDDQLTRG